VAVGQDNFHRVFAFDSDLAASLKADYVLLKPQSALGPHPLFFGADWCPACLSHAGYDVRRWQKGVPAADSRHGLPGEDARGRDAELLVGDFTADFAVIGTEHNFFL
jgi:hypothetical protein